MTNIYEFVNVAGRSRDVIQQLVVDTIQANNFELEENLIIPNLNVVNDLIVGNDAFITGTLTAGNIIGNITDEDIDVNTISTANTGNIQINNTLEIEENNINNSGQIESKGIILNEDSTFVKNALAQVHIQKDNGSPILYLESAGTGGECFIDFKQQNGQVAGQIQLDWPPIACMDFKVGQVASPNWGLFRFFASQVSSTAKGVLPNFITNTEIMRIGGSGTLEINMYKELLLNNNDISEVNNLELNSISKNGLGDISIDSNTIFQAPININNNVCSGVSQLNSDHGTAINFFPGSPNIISLDAPRLLMSGYIDMDNNNIIKTNDISLETISANTTNIVLNNDIDLNGNSLLNASFGATSFTGTITMNNNSINGFNSCSGSRLNTNIISDNNGINPISVVGQGMNFSTGTPLILTNRTLDNAQNKLLVLDGSNIVKYRDVSSLPSSNPFNQNLNSTDSPTFNNLTINSNIDLTQGNLNNTLQINNVTANITLNPLSFVLLANNKSIGLNDGFLSINNPLASIPPAPGGFQGYIYKLGANLHYKSGTNDFRLNSIFGTDYNSANSLGVSSTASPLNNTKINLGVFVQAGDYNISWYSEITNSNKNNESDVSLTIDGGVIANVVTPQLLFGEDYQPFSGTVISTLTTGVHNIDLLYHANATTARIRNSYIQMFRIS